MVKLGEDTENGCPVAIKLIDKTSLSPIERNSVKTEAEVMSYLTHKNIVGIHAVFENMNHVCMVLEYAGGGELFDYITRRTKIQEAEARKFFLQLLAGIGYAHSKRIIHRDIKAENIFLDEKLENVKIGDWGFATVFNPGQKAESQCGTLHYTAPEIFTQDPYIGPEADVWAIGVLVYFMVCGWLPYRGTTDFDVYCKIKKGDFHTLPSSVSDHFKDLIKNIFTVNRLHRPTIETLSRHPWCLLSQSDPEYLRRPKMPRLLQLQIKQHQKKPLNLMESQLENSNPIITTTEPEPITESVEVDRHNKLTREKRSRTNEAKTEVRRRKKAPTPEQPTPTQQHHKLERTQTEHTKTTSRPKRTAKVIKTRNSKKEPLPADQSAKVRRRKNQICEEDEDEMVEAPVVYSKPTTIEEGVGEAPATQAESQLSVKNGPVEASPRANREDLAASSGSPETRRGRRASLTLTQPLLSQAQSPPRTISPSKIRPSLRISPSPAKTRRGQPIRTPRGTVKISSFSVLRVNSSGLANLKDSKEVELLSVEKTNTSSIADEYVVLVSATADRGQETKVLELLKTFECGATKLKKSKSLEDIPKYSLFKSLDSPLTESLQPTPSKTIVRRAQTPQSRRRGATWDTADFGKYVGRGRASKQEAASKSPVESRRIRISVKKQAGSASEQAMHSSDSEDLEHSASKVGEMATPPKPILKQSSRVRIKVSTSPSLKRSLEEQLREKDGQQEPELDSSDGIST
eukprot:TRINITY_DN13424_c0_g2_i1.p1 TRINITY_DN13424_c0_g2~~TRINITY_DN13424_c0_g2_i1.p1  ORF type:complete len:795 (+),score=146.02 TRINITY_DN13424_c0_g2_i1:152-2386(+)